MLISAFKQTIAQHTTADIETHADCMDQGEKKRQKKASKNFTINKNNITLAIKKWFMLAQDLKNC